MIFEENEELLKAYQSIYTESSNKNNVVDDIANSILNAMNYYGFFTNSDIVREITNEYEKISNLDFDYKRSQEYGKFKSRISKEINNISNEKFMSSILDMPYDLKQIKVYFQFLPEEKDSYKNNYDIGGLFNPEQDYITFVITLAGIIPNSDEFIKNLKPIIVHEFVHIRQAYEAKLNNVLLSLPKMYAGKISKSKNLELMEKILKEYLMHPAELEAYAVEYNYYRSNNYDIRTISEFAKSVFEKNLSTIDDSGDDAFSQALREFFDNYLNALTKYIKTYKYTVI